MDKLFLLLLALDNQPDSSVSRLIRICTESFKGEASLSASSLDAVTTALLLNKNIRLTENCSKTDWKLKGSVVERADLRSRSDEEETGIASARINFDRNSGSGGAMSARSKEGLSSSETIRSVTLSVRLLTPEGEVVASSTQDSKGSKSRSPLAEAAERASADLLKAIFPPNAKPSVNSPGARADGYQKIK